jgi:hemolysin activation/secretion protein
MFAGGHNNLLGYRQYRFAGEQMLYNNLELRLRLASFTGYIIPGEFGMLGFYDVGRVWIKNESSNTWHHGTGGGLYFAPAKLAVISVVAGHSVEGWYPYIKLGFRF